MEVQNFYAVSGFMWRIIDTWNVKWLIPAGPSQNVKKGHKNSYDRRKMFFFHIKYSVCLNRNTRRLNWLEKTVH